MELKLEKQKLVSLTLNEMESVNGGGQKRSDRLNGNCAYSRKWRETGYHADTNNNGCVEWIGTGCADKAAVQ